MTSNTTSSWTIERVESSVLHGWSERILRSAGASEAAAAATAGVLVDANRRGLDSHGVAMLAFYLPRLRSGVTDGAATPAVLVDRPGLALLDGRNGLGAFVASQAMDLCCTKAETAGAAVVLVRNSSHFGAASCFAELATRRGCVGLVLSNSDPGLAPEGALKPILGTNPLAIAAPAGSAGITPSLDIATSVVAQGKVILAARSHEPIPTGWAIGRDGRPTTDPEEALANSVLPMGGHKGFALAFMIDVLVACLSGAAISPEIHEGPDVNSPQRTGHLFLAIHLNASGVDGTYADALDRLVTAVHEAPRAAWAPEFLIPGEREAAAGKERTAGIPLSPETVALLRELGAGYGVPFFL